MSVIVLKENGETLRDSFLRIFEKLGFQPNGKVLIKPNFSGRPPIIPGENTDPQFLRELIGILIEKGAEEVIIAHGALLGTPDKHFSFEEVINGGGFSFLYEMPKVKILDLDKEEKELLEFDYIKFLIPKILRTVDFYINLAKIKTHMEATVTFSLKNQMGLASVGDRIRMHKTDLETTIAYLGKLIRRPDFSIVDGIIAMEGNGPHHGKSKKLDMIVAGDDMVELDSSICFLLNIDFKKVKHIITAEQLGIGHFPSEDYLNSISKYKILDFIYAARYEKFGKNIYAWPTTGCSQCITALNESGKIVKKHPFKYRKLIKKIFFGNKKINIVIGKADNLKLSENEKIIAIGHCAMNFAQRCNKNCVDKCPPTVKETIDHINKEVNL